MAQRASADDEFQGQSVKAVSRRHNRISAICKNSGETIRSRTEKRFQTGEIDNFARICRVEAVMRPYLEALVA